jgi:hypothetical protein
MGCHADWVDKDDLTQLRAKALERYRHAADLIEGEYQLGGLTRQQAADAMKAVRLDYEQSAQDQD